MLVFFSKNEQMALEKSVIMLDPRQESRGFPCCMGRFGRTEWSGCMVIALPPPGWILVRRVRRAHHYLDCG
jgi:hypothetical protein